MIIGFQVTVKNVGNVFWGHSVLSSIFTTAARCVAFERVCALQRVEKGVDIFGKYINELI